LVLLFLEGTKDIIKKWGCFAMEIMGWNQEEGVWQYAPT
jgi:hypothetical protein